MLLSAPPASPNQINVTVDDQGIDPLTGASITYTPVGAWDMEGPAEMNPNDGAYNHTLHVATFDSGVPGPVGGSSLQTASFQFTGQHPHPRLT